MLNKKFSKPQCAEHNLPIQFLNVEDSNPTLLCKICKMSKKNASSEPLHIQDDIIDLTEDQISGEWPLNDIQLITRIQKILSDVQKPSLCQEAKEFFKWIIAQIIDMIDNAKSNYEKQATQASTFSQSLLEKYNQATQKQELQNLFQNMSQDNLAQISEDAKKIVSQVNSNSENCKQDLNKMLEQREMIIKTLNDPQQIKYDTYELIIQWIKKQQSLLPQTAQKLEEEELAQKTIENLKAQIEEIQQRNAVEEKRIRDQFTVQMKKLQDEIQALNKSLQEKEKEIKDQQYRISEANQNALSSANHQGCGRITWKKGEDTQITVKCSNADCRDYGYGYGYYDDYYGLACGDQCLLCRHQGRQGTLLCYMDQKTKQPITCQFNAKMSAEWKKTK